MKKKLLVVVQNISKAQEHEWFVEYLNREKFEIHFLLINCKGTFMDQFLIKKAIPVFHLSYSKKSELPSLTFNIFKILIKGKYKIIHTHLFEATLAGLTAALMAGVRKRIYTRHHSDYHHVWFPSAVKYDRYNNFLATDIVAISKNVESILVRQEQVPLSKVHLIHHGIDMTDYKPGAIDPSRINTIREKYNLKGNGPVVGAISRFTEWKGVQFMIPGFMEVLKHFPDAVLVLANANGDYKKEILKMLEQLDKKNFRIIEFENDVAALYQAFDCFVHVPINASAEAFGQTYLEALASRVPSVFTLSGIAPEFIKDKVNAMVVPFKDSKAITEAILYLLNNRNGIEAMVKSGYDSVADNFDIHVKISKLESLYS